MKPERLPKRIVDGARPPIGELPAAGEFPRIQPTNYYWAHVVRWFPWYRALPEDRFGVGVDADIVMHFMALTGQSWNSVVSYLYHPRSVPTSVLATIADAVAGDDEVRWWRVIREGSEGTYDDDHVERGSWLGIKRCCMKWPLPPGVDD